MERDYTSIRLEITSECNMNCLCCHNKEHLNIENDMKTEQILKLVTNLKNKYDINKVLLTGGEPLMQKDICEIIRSISQMGIKVDMVTNGTLLNYSKLKALEEAGLKRIRLSIDEVGNSSKVRDFTNPDKLWEKAKMIVENSTIELCIHTVASTYNVENLYNVYKKVVEVKARRWRVFDIGYQGGVVDNKEKFYFENYYQAFINSSAKIINEYISDNLVEKLDVEINNVFLTSFLYMKEEDFINFNFEEEMNAFLESSPCEYVANHQISVRSTGIATLCQYFYNEIYNYTAYDYDVEEAVKNKKYVVENEIKAKDLKYCSQCKYALVCNNGCRSRAEHLTNDILEADPVGCYLSVLIDKYIMPILPIYVQNIYNLYINKVGHDPKFDVEDLRKFLMLKGYNV